MPAISTFFTRGGICMYPLLFFGILIFAIGIRSGLRLLLWQWRTPSPGSPAGWAAEIRALIASGRGFTGIPLTESLEILLTRLEETLTRGLPALRFLAQTSCLLGFLGTVLGMITTFNTVASNGTVVPDQLAGGIHEALFTTLFGLTIAIAGWSFAFLLERIARHQVSGIETDLILALKSRSEGMSPG